LLVAASLVVVQLLVQAIGRTIQRLFAALFCA
jgi:hypothetical protein